MSSIVTATASSLPTATQQLSTEPPITQIIPILRATLTVLRVALRLVVALATPLLIFLPLLSHLFAPLILVFQIIFDAVVYTPYTIISTITTVLYPLYIFCGVACISGAVLGLLGRSLIALSNKFIAPPPKPPMAVQSSHAVSKRPRKRRRKGSFSEHS